MGARLALSAGGAVSGELQAVPGNHELLCRRSEARHFPIVRSPRKVRDDPTGDASKVVVVVRAPIIPCGSVAIGELHRQAAPDQCFEALVDRGEGDSRDVLPDMKEDFVRRRVGLGSVEVPEYGSSLLGEALPIGLQGLAEDSFYRFGRVEHGAVVGRTFWGSRSDPKGLLTGGRRVGNPRKTRELHGGASIIFGAGKRALAPGGLGRCRESRVTGPVDRSTVDTLEPLIDAVRDGVEGEGWTLSGLQKTSSTEFEGRWAGQSTRSAYLFFHREDLETVSVEAYLDETSRGLTGSLGLVADVRPLWELESVPRALNQVAALARAHLPEGYQTPVTLRLRLPRAEEDAREAELEARVKLRIPRAAMAAGSSAVSALAAAVVKSLEAILEDPHSRTVLDLDGEGGLS
jgi:hypothetical protein